MFFHFECLVRGIVVNRVTYTVIVMLAIGFEIVIWMMKHFNPIWSEFRCSAIFRLHFVYI